MFRTAVIIGYCLLLGCSEGVESKKEGLMSASTCMKKLSDGSTVECEPPTATVNKLDSWLSGMRKINEQFPGPEGPPVLDIKKDQLHRVKDVSLDGGLKLENGIRLKLAGLECNPTELAEYLESMFLKSNGANLYFKLTGYELNQYKYAYIWEVDFESADYESGVGERISIPNENLLLTGQCNPIAQEKHLFLERYKRIATLGG